MIDAGALQALTPADLKTLPNLVITPHVGEFERLFKNPKSEIRNPNEILSSNFKNQNEMQNTDEKQFNNLTNKPLSNKELIVQEKAKEIGGIIVLKGPTDIIASPDRIVLNKTGNEGMTKGGTGDVLAGLIAALMTTNDLFTAAAVGTYINGLAGDELYKTVGPYFNADDLADMVPQTLWREVKTQRES